MKTNPQQILVNTVSDEDSGRDDLWMRISAFRLDDPASSLPYSKRLARENGWSRHFACRVIEEYKKFCYIAVTSGHSVTPSDAVDQAWHLHLLYTESYWDGFCAHVLGRPLHHSPTRGGLEESSKFHSWYEQTLRSYDQIFGPPPRDIWPDVRVRFSPSASFRRINVANYWLLPKPRPRLFRG